MFANFGIKGTLVTLLLWCGFGSESPLDEMAAAKMRIFEPPHHHHPIDKFSLSKLIKK
jgi:hypothetical protein